VSGKTSLLDVLAEYALALVYLIGAAEVAGALGLSIPLAIYKGRYYARTPPNVRALQQGVAARFT